MKQRRKSTKQEPTTALINIVFLILIFFMVAGTLSKPASKGIEFVSSEALECCAPTDALAIAQDGSLTLDDYPLPNIAHYRAKLPTDAPIARLAPDRNLPAQDLVSIVQQLNQAGISDIKILTEISSK